VAIKFGGAPYDLDNIAMMCKRHHFLLEREDADAPQLKGDSLEGGDGEPAAVFREKHSRERTRERKPRDRLTRLYYRSLWATRLAAPRRSADARGLGRADSPRAPTRTSGKKRILRAV
jgi:hypothetical protein